MFTLVSAATIGTFREGDNVTIYQTCNNCTSINFTRVMNFENQVLVSNLEATKDNTYFSTLILSGNLTKVGVYQYCYEAGNAVETKTGCISFEVTFTGRQMTESMATVYVITITFLIFLLILIVVGITRLPSKDETDEAGTILEISNLKHLRPVLWGFCWGLILAMLFIISNMTLAYLPNKMVGDFFFMLFKIMGWMTLPMIFIWFIWIFTGIFRDKEYKRMMERGVESNQF